MFIDHRCLQVIFVLFVTFAQKLNTASWSYPRFIRSRCFLKLVLLHRFLKSYRWQDSVDTSGSMEILSLHATDLNRFAYEKNGCFKKSETFIWRWWCIIPEFAIRIPLVSKCTLSPTNRTKGFDDAWRDPSQTSHNSKRLQNLFPCL